MPRLPMSARLSPPAMTLTLPAGCMRVRGAPKVLPPDAAVLLRAARSRACCATLGSITILGGDMRTSLGKS